MEQKRLVREIEVLQRCEKRTGLTAKPIIDQLIVDSERPLPDQLPDRPQWVRFQWPRVGIVDFNDYWRNIDRGRWP